MPQSSPQYDLARLRYGVAQALLMDAQTLRDVKGIDPPPEQAVGILFLMAFSTELYLKAFLLQAGVPDGTLGSRPYGHDLRKLLDEATGRGLVFSQSPLLEKMVDHLREAHLKLELRYMPADRDIRVPADIGTCLQVLLHLDDHLARRTDVLRARPGRAEE